MDKIRVLSSTTAIKFMEENLMRIEKQIEALTEKKARKEAERPADVSKVLARVKYFLEHQKHPFLQGCRRSLHCLARKNLLW